MLCISMKAGEYFTVDGKTVIQFDRLNGDRARLMIQAPKEVPIVRGTVLEREGGKRPECVFVTPRRNVKQLPWNPDKKKALLEMRQALDRMGDSPDARFLRERLEYMFPSFAEKKEAEER